MKLRGSFGVEKYLDTAQAEGKQLNMKTKNEDKFTLIEIRVIAGIITAIAAVSAPLVVP